MKGGGRETQRGGRIGLDWIGYDRTVWCRAEFLSIFTVKSQDETNKYAVAVCL